MAKDNRCDFCNHEASVVVETTDNSYRVCALHAREVQNSLKEYVTKEIVLDTD